ncbi:MAG: HigA family addiction module antitoxin [Bacillota bacterium]
MVSNEKEKGSSGKYYPFEPDYAVPPGATLLETIEHLGLSQAELAERMGRPVKTINEIIKGKTAIIPETALQLERVLGIPASFWNNLERNYREKLAELAEQERLKKQLAWLKEIPVNHMIKHGWIKRCKDKITQLREVLNFFGVASVEAWQEHWQRTLGGQAIAFRQSKTRKSELGAIAAWLRKGQLEAQGIPCKPFDADSFKNILGDVRNLTLHPPAVFVPGLKKMCAKAGVAVVFVPELPGSRTHGATYWLNPRKAVIQLSLRYKTDDHLWFTFFHEAKHVLQHRKRDLFLEYDGQDDIYEEQANRFAEQRLIPSDQLNEFLKKGNFSEASVRQFAKCLGIAPGIVVGRLQHEKAIGFNNLNHLKRYFQWT